MNEVTIPLMRGMCDIGLGFPPGVGNVVTIPLKRGMCDIWFLNGIKCKFNGHNPLDAGHV